LDVETTMPTVQHIYCSAIISKKMCDALTSYVFSISAAKGGVDEFVVEFHAGKRDYPGELTCPDRGSESHRSDRSR
jgi:hypothetical protein